MNVLRISRVNRKQEVTTLLTPNQSQIRFLIQRSWGIIQFETCHGAIWSTRRKQVLTLIELNRFNVLLTCSTVNFKNFFLVRLRNCFRSAYLKRNNLIGCLLPKGVCSQANVLLFKPLWSNDLNRLCVLIMNVKTRVICTTSTGSRKQLISDRAAFITVTLCALEPTLIIKCLAIILL